MIELVFLVGALAAIREAAKRRGSAAWAFVATAAVGWFVAGNAAAYLFGPGPHIFFSWGWVGLTYLAVFVIGGGGRRREATWQCPQCRLYNPPTTLVCPCGYEPPDDG